MQWAWGDNMWRHIIKSQEAEYAVMGLGTVNLRHAAAIPKPLVVPPTTINHNATLSQCWKPCPASELDTDVIHTSAVCRSCGLGTNRGGT